MKNLYKILIVAIIPLLFTACGGGGSGGTVESATSSTTKIDIISCASGSLGVNDCGTTSNPYTCVQNGDTLVSENGYTEIEVVHASDDSKKVCVKVTNPAGAAYILR